jgi:hypothetical protein
MSNELLPLLDILAEPPKNADHGDAVVTGVTNGSGGGLLTHDLNSYPQTNGVATMVDRLDAATGDDSPTPVSTVSAGGLAGVAVAIRQIESVLKANGALAPEVHFAIERVHDVAMALRMREVDAALCDTLEASIREIGDAIVRNDAAAAQTQSAAALLRDLGKRIDQMVPPVPIVAIKPDKPDKPGKPDKTDEAASVATSGDHAPKANGAAPRPAAYAVGVVVSDDDHARSLLQPAFVHPALAEMRPSADARQQPASPAQPVALSIPSPVDDDADAAANGPPVAEQASNRSADPASEPISVETAAFAVSYDGQAVPPATTSVPSAAEINAAAPANSPASPNDPLAALYGLSEEELIALFS